MRHITCITSPPSEKRNDLPSLSFQPSLYLTPYPIPPKPEPPKPSLHLSPYPIPPKPEPPKPSLHLSPYPIPYPDPGPDNKNGFCSLQTEIFKRLLSFKKSLSFLIDLKERNSIREYSFVTNSFILSKTELHSQKSVKHYFVKLNLQKLVYASLLGSLNKTTNEHSESAYNWLYDLKQNSLEFYYDNDESKADSFVRTNDLLSKITNNSAHAWFYESLNEIDLKQNSLGLYYDNDRSNADGFATTNDLLNKIIYNSAHAWFYESLNEIDLKQNSLGLKLYKDICDLLFSVLSDIEHRLVSIENNDKTCLIFDTTFVSSKKQTISKIEFVNKEHMNNLLPNNYSKKKGGRIVSAGVLSSLLSNQTGSIDLYRLCKILMVDQLRLSVQIKCDKICNEGGVKEFKLLSYEESGIINFNICIALTMPPKANKSFYPIPQKSCLLRVN